MCPTFRYIRHSGAVTVPHPLIRFGYFLCDTIFAKDTPLIGALQLPAIGTGWFWLTVHGGLDASEWRIDEIGCLVYAQPEGKSKRHVTYCA